jgi:hypothetical protein
MNTADIVVDLILLALVLGFFWAMYAHLVRQRSTKNLPSVTIEPDKPWPCTVEGYVQRHAVRIIAGQSYVSLIVDGAAYHESTNSRSGHDLRALSLLRPGDKVHLVLEGSDITEFGVEFGAVKADQD